VVGLFYGISSLITTLLFYISRFPGGMGDLIAITTAMMGNWMLDLKAPYVTTKKEEKRRDSLSAESHYAGVELVEQSDIYHEGTMRTRSVGYRMTHKSEPNRVVWMFLLLPGYLLLVHILLYKTGHATPPVLETFLEHYPAFLGMFFWVVVLLFGLRLHGDIIGHVCLVVLYPCFLSCLYMPASAGSTWTHLFFDAAVTGNAFMGAVAIFFGHVFSLMASSAIGALFVAPGGAVSAVSF